MTLILAVDQSTSATKAILFGLNGELVAKTAIPHRQHYPQPGWVEHDADEIYHNSLTAITSLLDQTPDSREQLLCLSITNQRETFVVFDRHSGRPLYNAIVWQCRRGAAICAELVQAGHEPAVQQATGLKIDTYFPAAKLKWLLDQRPDIRRRLADGSALFGTIDTYLVYRLTGGQVYATDHTNASRTLFFDIDRMTWSGEMCRLFDVPGDHLPDVRESSARFGETDLDGRLDRPIPICGVMGDSQAALFAQRCFEPGSGKVTFGTGSSVLLNIGQRMVLSSSGVVTAVGWVYEGRPTYAFEGITNFTGATIAWLRDQLQLIDSVDEAEALATAVEDNGGVYLVPAFVGLSAPYWQPEARAAIVGLTPGSDRRHVARAALESIAYRVRDVLQLMAEEASAPLRHVHADGGAVRNRFLMQFVASMVQRTVRASTLPELSALGAALSGALGMGVFGSVADLQQLEMGFVDFEPVFGPETAQSYYAGWQNAVAQVTHRP